MGGHWGQIETSDRDSLEGYLGTMGIDPEASALLLSE